MAPIYDTDLAEERFAKSEWNQYELWERVEIRLRRRKRLWIGATVLVFLCLASVPTVIDRWPRWMALASARRLAQEINWIKRAASEQHAAFRIRFEGDGSLRYVVEKGASCADPHPARIRAGAIGPESEDGVIAPVMPEQGRELGVPGLVGSYCYDYLAGSDLVLQGESLVGFGIAPVKDLAERRLDRVVLLLLSGPSAEISFE